VGQAPAGGAGFSLRGTSVPPPARRWLWPGVAAVSLIAAVVLGFLYLHPKSAPATPVRFEIAQPANVSFSDSLAISPDGRKLAFEANFFGRGGGGAAALGLVPRRCGCAPFGWD
jgi:hypothetical protein